MQAATPLFFRKSDDALDKNETACQKLDICRKALSRELSLLKPLRQALQWNPAADFDNIYSQLNSIEARVQVLALTLYGPGGICKQIPVQVKLESIPQVICDELSLELQVLLTAKSIKRLKKFCNSPKARVEFLTVPFESKVGIVEEDICSKGKHDPAFSFWKNIPYATNAWATLGYYPETSQIGLNLETKVGQPLSALSEKLDEQLSSVACWNMDATSIKCRIQALYNTFLALYSLEIPNDDLTRFIHDYACGLKFAFRQVRAKLKTLEKFSSERALASLRAMNGYVGQFDSAYKEFDKVAQIYASVQQMAALESRKDLPEGAFKGFLDRLVTLLHDVHAVVDTRFLQVHKNEVEAAELVLSLKSEIHEMPLVSYLAKRMVLALYFPLLKAFDIELELVWALYKNKKINNSAFDSIALEYEKNYAEKRAFTDDRIREAGIIAGAIIKAKNANKDVAAYASLLSQVLEYISRLGHGNNAYKHALVKHLFSCLATLAEKFEYSIMDKRVQKANPAQIDKFVQDLRVGARTRLGQEEKQKIFTSILLRLVAEALFASDVNVQKKISKHDRIYF